MTVDLLPLDEIHERGLALVSRLEKREVIGSTPAPDHRESPGSVYLLKGSVRRSRKSVPHTCPHRTPVGGVKIRFMVDFLALAWASM
jgi:hypothetical protein